MMKSGDQPDKVKVPYHLLPIEFHRFKSKIDLLGLLSLFGSLSYLNFFRDGMGPFNH